jgi:hypothetical protein
MTMTNATSLMQPISILTPYVMPEGTRKISNVGNGIILKAVERHLSAFPLGARLTSFAAPKAEQLDSLEKSPAVVIAGANLLDDNFAPWPELKAEALQRSKMVIVPMGVGLHGEPHRNAAMSENTRQLLDLMHARAEYSSWRCPLTVAYLLKERPKLASQVLMTGCPVLYDRPLLESTRFNTSRDVIAVTVTERDNFWTREVAVIDYAAREFPSARKLLVLHQDYLRGQQPGLLQQLTGRWLRTAQGLRSYARARGFEIRIPATHDEVIDLYRDVDLHMGSRLHAHLLMLSQNKRSFLIRVDDRSTGIAEHFGFPLCDPERLSDYQGFDFEVVRQAALRTFPVMEKFINSLPRS